MGSLVLIGDVSGATQVGDVLGGRQVGDVWTCEPQTQDGVYINRWLSQFYLLAYLVVRKLYVLMGDRIVLKCFCSFLGIHLPLISLLNGKKS